MEAGASVESVVLTRVLAIVQDVTDSYIDELRQHVGVIPGESDYADAEVAWQALDADELASGGKFWYKTGAVANSLFAVVDVVGGVIRAKAGIAASDEAYDEAIWNELGFVPHGSSKVIKRPLFIPLAMVSVADLQSRITAAVAGARIRITVKI